VQAGAFAAAGDHREAYLGTKLLLHRAEIDPPGNSRWTAAAHKQRAASWKRTDEKVLNVYAASAPGSRKLLEREMETESFLPLPGREVMGIDQLPGRRGAMDRRQAVSPLGPDGDQVYRLGQSFPNL